MDKTSENPQIVLSRTGKANSEQVTQGLQDIRDSRDRGIWRNTYPYPEKVPLEGELRENIEHDISLAHSLMLDIGYSSEDATQLLPTVDQVYVYRVHSNSDHTRGAVTNEGGRVDLEFEDFYVSLHDWKRLGSNFVHELGHYPAQRIYGPGIQENSPVRLISFGFDRFNRYVTELGDQYFVSDQSDTYTHGISREPMADLFGYFCTEKRNNNTAYHANSYTKETAFMISLLSKLCEIRGTKIFEEFARGYKAFNSGDVSYFVSLRDDFANYWEKSGLSKDEAFKKSTHLISSLNNIQGNGGKDYYPKQRVGNITNWTSGSQLAEVAKEGEFNENYDDTVKAIMENRLVLEGCHTRMTKRVEE